MAKYRLIKTGNLFQELEIGDIGEMQPNGRIHFRILPRKGRKKERWIESSFFPEYMEKVDLYEAARKACM